ncbi:T9SS type A sorting domain-containing protein [Lentimicrobium sp. S6]|uniref:T9SS type A sorting domain-containing protein n=1 Tax=Lentimicrobium sp. S6 TaxID=2735872 RepID=UPI001555077A|nr:T9SS type A sorting domain-containing protein [Lentimicrobium sp. S6]NPD47627.1 T9SS type A sorting domain-containing protein [Lentimicrobium sp. S6]
MKSLVLLLLCSIFPYFIYSQLPRDIIWQSIYGTSEEDVVQDIVETQDAIYILSRTRMITGPGYDEHHNDLLVTKTNIDGEYIWQKNYGGSLDETPASIASDDLGMIYLGAGTYSDDGDIQSGNMGGHDFWVVKIDTSGQVVWEQTYGGSMTDYGAYLLYLENGNILAYGPTFSSDNDVNINYGYLDIWIWEITPQGEIVKSRVFGSSQSDNIFSLIQTDDGGFFTAARAGANDGVVNSEPRGWHDVWLLKLDAQLNIEWQKLIGGSNFDAGGYGLAQLDDGGYILNGSTKSSDGDVHGFDFPDVPDQDDIWVVRIDSMGNILWDIALGGDEWEHSSKVFANEDGSFTVFGTTNSPNNGDVVGKHHTLLYPHNINSDIWMLKLSSEGELLDQRCFGNASQTRLSRAVIKKSDSHYLIAGTGFSRQADPDNPEAPTDGEVWGGYESESYDIWFFEAVDCEFFQPDTPSEIEGEDSVCSNNSSQYTYTTQIINPQYEEAQWLLEPAEAGALTNLQDSVIIEWNSTFEGQAALSVRSISNCGESAYTQAKLIEVEICLGLGEINKKSLFLYPNPATNQITFELPNIKKQSQVQIKDIYGKLIATLNIKPNQSQLIWECGAFASGVYFYEGEIGGEVYRGKLIIK